MAKNSKKDIQNKALQLQSENVVELENEYINEIENNPEYALIVDPDNQYNFDDITKSFIYRYIDSKSVPYTSQLCGIEVDEGMRIYSSFAVQQEIRRLSTIMYHRQFAHKIMSMQEIAGYLSSLITDENVALADRLQTKDKLQVIRMLIDLNTVRSASMVDPKIASEKDTTETIKNLSVGAIKALLEQSTNDNNSKTEIISQINNSKLKDGQLALSPEEAAYLETLSSDELLSILNDQYS